VIPNIVTMHVRLPRLVAFAARLAPSWRRRGTRKTGVGAHDGRWRWDGSSGVLDRSQQSPACHEG